MDTPSPLAEFSETGVDDNSIVFNSSLPIPPIFNPSCNEAEDESEHEKWRSEHRYLFKYIIVSILLLFSVEGILPCVLHSVSVVYDLNPFNQGVMGGTYFITSALSSPICAQLVQKMGDYTKWYFIISLVFSTAGVIFLVFVPSNIGSMGPIASQMVLGLFGTPAVVFGYVWMNLFSSPSERTMWTGIYQSTMVLGSVFGYLIGIVVTSIVNKSHQYEDIGEIWGLYDYQIAFLFVAVFEALFIILISILPKESFNIKKATERLTIANREEEQHRLRSVFQNYFASCINLICNVCFMCGVLSLTFLFFVLRGVNYWGTEYLTKTFPEQSRIVIRICFLAIAITAPIFGLVCGSNIGEIIVAYFDTREEYNYYNILWSIGLGLIASLFSITACHTSGFLSILISLWLVLFFGGALLPLVSVTLLEILEPKDRALATGFNSLVQQLFGQGGSLLMTGYIAQNISFQAAWTVLLSGSWFALVCVALMACSLRPNTLQNSNNNNNVRIKARAEGEMEQKKKEEKLARIKKVKKEKSSRLRKKTNINLNAKKSISQSPMSPSDSPFQSMASPASSTYIQPASKTIKLKSEYRS